MLLGAERDHHIVGTLIVAWDGWRGNMYRLAVLPLIAERRVRARRTDLAVRPKPLNAAAKGDQGRDLRLRVLTG